MTYLSDQRDAETQDDTDNESDINSASYYTKGTFNQEAGMKAIRYCTYNEQVVSDKDEIGRCY